jgi:hypothetical protein
MKKTIVTGILAAFLISFAGTSEIVAQKKDSPVFVDASVKNMHLWRGYKVSTSTLSTINAGYQSKNDRFKAGFWNGSSFDGSYTEFDYYLSYTFKSGLNLSIWDINNFSDFPNANIFDYNPATTSHFVDVSVSYPITPALSASVATIVLGRDTFFDNGDLRNAYSTYLELNYRIFTQDDITVTGYAGGAFSPLNEAHFYGTQPGIVNLGLTAGTVVPIFSGSFPISAQAMWNPQLNYGAMQLAIQLF